MKASGAGNNSNPLFRTSNPNFAAGQSGVNSYSAYQSPYGLGTDQTRENHALREQNFFGSANSTLDEYLERGRAVLGDLGDQREMLKGTHRGSCTLLVLRWEFLGIRSGWWSGERRRTSGSSGAECWSFASLFTSC